MVLLPRPLMAGVLALLVSAPVAFIAPATAEPSTRQAAVLRASQPDIIPGERITLVAGAPTGAGYTSLSRADRRRTRLVLQRRVDGAWVKVAAQRLRTTRVRFAYSAPRSARGTLTLRTVGKLRGRTFRGGRLSLPVVAQRLSSEPGALTTRSSVAFATTLTPLRAGRPVSLQEHRDGAWTAVATRTLGSTIAVVVGTQAPAHPVWYRVVAPAWNGVPALTTAPVRTTLDRVPGVVAHRAGAGVAPEQTLAAVQRARADAAPAMEVDVQLSADRELVIVHDHLNLKRTTDVETVFPDRSSDPVGTFTLAEIKQLDAGSWFSPEFAGERIPTLDEVIAAMGGEAGLVLEVKEPALPGNAGIADELAAELASGPLGDLAAAGRITVSSFDHGWLEAFATAHPDVPVGVLTVAPPSAADLDAWQPWAEEVHPNNLFLTRSDADAIRSRGMTSSVWTVRTVADFRLALASGADRVITDFPARLAEVVDPPRPAA
ncbi:MAG: hypothetical protein LT071_08080 [Nocardioides sp.]|nr:hypothetical protein [Nocardioides sp.]